MELHHISPLAKLVALQLLLYGTGWLVCGLVLPAQRGAVLHWSLCMMLGAGALMLTAARTEPRLWWPFVGSNLLMIGAFAAMRHGNERFFGVKSGGREQLLLLAVAGAALFAIGPQAEHAAARVFVVGAFIGYTLLRHCATTRGAFEAEFGRLACLLSNLAPVVLGIVFAARAAQQALVPEVSLESHRALLFNVDILFVLLGIAALFNMEFMSLVILRLLLRLRRLSHHDELTGLMNRRAMGLALEREWQQRLRTQAPLSVLAVDIDHFKRVNDTHGHAAGDAVLAHTARLLQQYARPVDSVGRMGGEEFLVLLPGAAAEAATAAADRVRLAVSRESVPACGVPIAVTVSIGIGTVRSGDRSLQEAITRADAALYRAKQSGRNRTACEDAPGLAAASAC